MEMRCKLWVDKFSSVKEESFLSFRWIPANLLFKCKIFIYKIWHGKGIIHGYLEKASTKHDI